MAQFEYFATFDESVDLLRDLVGNGFSAIPSRPYDQPDVEPTASVTKELVRLLEEGPVFYLAGAFTRFPIQYHQIIGGEADRKYAINPLAQGPVMQCRMGRLRTVEGLPTLLWGHLSYDGEGYRNPDTNLWEKPSDELKAAYKQAVAITKKHTVPYRSGIAIRIGPEALRLLERGEARITYPGFVNPAPRAA